MTREINAGEHSPTAPRQQWRTSRALGARIVERFGIDLDALASFHNALVPRYIAAEGDLGEPVAVDALAVRWSVFGTSIFANAPFVLLPRVAPKIIEAVDDGASVVLLAPDNGDTRWYTALVDRGAHVWRFRGRVHYEPDVGVESAGGGSAFPSSLYVFDQRAGAVERRVPGSPIPTFACDPRTLELL